MFKCCKGVCWIFPMALTIGLLSTFVMGAEKGNGKGGKDNPPLPDIAYRLTWLGTFGGEDSFAHDINDAGVVVGGSLNSEGDWRAFRIIPIPIPDVDNGHLEYWLDDDNDGVNNLMEDLNDVPATWTDLEDPGVPATGWLALNAHGINELGEIVGTAGHSDTGETRVFLLAGGNTPQFSLLPSLGAGSHRGSAINDNGTIVGIRRDPGVSVTAIVYTWPSGSEGYLGANLVAADLAGRGIDINNAGQMVIAGYDDLEGYWGHRLTPVREVARFDNTPSICC